MFPYNVKNGEYNSASKMMHVHHLKIKTLGSACIKNAS